MDKEKCERIKAKATESLAPMRDGIIALDEVVRLFSYLGTRKEIEGCLDQLVQQATARKFMQSKTIVYVFEGMARKFGAKWENDISEFRTQNEDLEKTVEDLRQKIDHLEDLKQVWTHDWNKQDEMYQSILYYISAVVFGQEQINASSKIEENNQRISENSRRIKEAQKKLADSRYSEIARDGNGGEAV